MWQKCEGIFSNLLNGFISEKGRNLWESFGICLLNSTNDPAQFYYQHNLLVFSTETELYIIKIVDKPANKHDDGWQKTLALQRQSIRNILSKGLLILKCLIGVLNSPKNWQKQFDFRVKLVLISFFGRIEDSKKTFRN